MTPCLRPAESYRAPHPRALADCAVAALIDEACLTPKPALVDQRGSGAHGDLDLDTMHRSARALHPAFLAIARVSALERPTQALRERLGRIGRDGEHAMLRATNGSNAHRGAIWIVGLLCAGAAMTGSVDSSTICAKAACVARFDDRELVRAFARVPAQQLVEADIEFADQPTLWSVGQHVGQIGAGEVRVVEIGAGDDRAPKAGITRIGLAEVRPFKVAA